MRKIGRRILSCLVMGLMLVFVGVPAAFAVDIYPSIGFDYSGTGNFSDIDQITYRTDTGIASGFDPQYPPTNIPYIIDFWLQGRVGTFQNDGSPVIYPTLALDLGEMTFVTQFQETVVGFAPNTGNILTATAMVATFQGGEDLNSLLEVWVDPYTYVGPGSPLLKSSYDTTSEADPNVVDNYRNGVKILEGHIYSNTSSFSKDIVGPLGTGSFDIVFKIDSYDANYWNLPVDMQFLNLHSTGTLNQPTFFNPTQLWDGTLISSLDNPQLLKFDGSTDFQVVPEPSTFALLGFGLLGVGILVRRKKS